MKNINCVNPKFYELFTFNYREFGNDDDTILIQVINVEPSGEWKLICSTDLNLKQFKDQLVHEVVLDIPVLKNPENIISTSFRHRDEISDFSMLMSED